MFDFIDKGLEKFKNTVAQAAQSVAPTVQNLQNSYVNAYQKVSPYIPLAPRFLNSQQAQQNFQPFINDFNKGFSNPQSYNDNFTQAPIGQQIGATTRPLYDALNTAGSPFKPLMQSAQDFSQRPNPIAAAQVGLNTLGLAKMTPTGYALNTAFGAGINKIFNPQQSFTQSLQQGSEGAPLLSGVGALVNPVEEGITGALSSKLLPKGVNSLKQAAIEKGIAGVGQVPFGATLRAVSGQNPVDPMGVVGDIAFGSAGKYLDDRFQPKVKGTIGRTPNLLDPEDAGYYYRAQDILKDKKSPPEQINQAKQVLYNLAERYLSPEDRPESGSVKAIIKALDEKAGKSNVYYGNSPFMMGVYSNGEYKTPYTIGTKDTRVNPNYTPITLKDGEVQPLEPKENLKQLLQLPTQKGESVAQKRGQMLSEDPFIQGLEQDKLKYKDLEMEPPTNPKSPENNPTINTDKSTQYEANIKGGGFDKIDPQVKQDFADWVNQRKATQVEGLFKKQQFSDLNSKGIQGIFEFQSGNKEGRYADVKKYFDSKYQDIQDTGLDLNYKRDYLPQLWANSREEVEQKLGRSLGTNPSFSFDSLIKNYKEGIEKNLTPRFNTISDLIGWYEKTANKAIADRNYFTKLATDGLIQPASKAPRDWITIDPDRFPKVKVNIPGEVSYVGTYKAPPELGKMINNYLKDPQHGFMNMIANFVSAAKNRTLSFGVPGTGINAHGINILARHTLFGTGGNPITRFITGSQYMLNPGSAESALTKNLSHAGDAVKNGLTLSTEDHNALLNEAENVATKFGKQWNNYFEKPLFGKMIPALKLSSYQELIKNGMDGKDAAKLVNNVYGGINWEQLGRNRDTQNLMRAIILAPDWAESTLRLGGNIAKSLTPFGGATGARYRAMAATLLGSYIAANVANKISSGHYMYENDTGHTFEIEAGFTGDGQKRYIRPYGTAVDFVRLPVDILQGLLRGDPSAAFRAFSNRLSIPLSAASHLLFNVDYKGNPIYGKTVSGLQAAGGIGSELAGMAGTPSFIKNIADTVTGKQGVEQGLTQSLELPLRYSGGEATKKLVTQLQAKNTSNQDINQQLQNMYQRSQNKQDVLQNISPEVKQALASIDQIKKLDPNDPQRKAAEALLFKLYPQAFAAQQQLAYLNSNNNENLVDPLYRHGNEQVAQKLLTYNSLPPSSAEKKQYYKNNADLGAFEEQRVNWQKQNPYTGSGNGFSYNPPPQPNNYVLQQMAAKNFNDPQVQQYLQDKNVYDNQQRQKWGLDTVDSYGNIQGSKNFGVSFSKGSSYALRRLKSQVNRPVKARKLKTSKPKMAKLRIKTAKLAKVKPLKLKV